MTVWLTPAGKPFFAGTYFPPDDRHGMPSFRRVMASVAEAWSERRDGIEDQASHLTATISREVPPTDSIPGSSALATAYRQLEASFDHVHGGFGGAPKFPQQPVLEFLLRATGRAWAPEAERMVETTLEQMAAGGIRDHVGGGFARYAVDGHWLIPHFEKMLYDNAQLARLYLRASQVIGNDHFREIAVETLDYLARDLRHRNGGFYSAEDADSEGIEGKFYVWTESEFRSVVGSGADVAGAYFGVDAAGNFEGDNHLHEAVPLSQVAERFDMTTEEASEIVATAKVALLERRLTRVRPGLDDKIITGWNGLALRAFAEAGAVLEDDGYLEIARQNARFILANLRKPDGRLLRSWGKGIATIPGFLDDYAGYALGLFTLYQATGEVEWYVEAERLVREMLRLFTHDGRLYSTGSDAEQLITRPQDQMDNPLPSGSSLAAEALLWLSLYTGEADLAGAVESAIRDSASLVGQYPSAVGHLLAVLTSMDIGTHEVAIVGPEPHELSRVLWESFQPELVIAIDRAGTDGKTVPLLRDRASEGKTLAYVCEGFVCRLPVSDPAELRAQLS
jgi:hypothetical protein